MHAGIVLGLLITVLVLDPPKLVCRVLFGSYNCDLKSFHFGELLLPILGISGNLGPFLDTMLKIKFKIKGRQTTVV